MGKIIRTSSGKNGSLFKDRFFICFFAVFCAGVIIGSVLSGIYLNKPESLVFAMCEQNIKLLDEGSLFSVFVHNMISCLLYLAAIYSCGLCAVGIIYLYFTTLFFSLGRGLFMGYLFACGDLLEGIKRTVFYVPQNILFCTTFLLALCISAKMSAQTFTGVTKTIVSDLSSISYKKYNQKFIIYTVFFTIYALFDALLMKFMN